jgi:hypothetical protein
MPKANSFDVFKIMCASDNKKLQLSPLGNILGAKKVKAGTQVTIGVSGNVVTGITFGQYVGGLILCDKDEFERIAKMLEEGKSAEEVVELLQGSKNV